MNFQVLHVDFTKSSSGFFMSCMWIYQYLHEFLSESEHQKLHVDMSKAKMDLSKVEEGFLEAAQKLHVEFSQVACGFITYLM